MGHETFLWVVNGITLSSVILSIISIVIATRSKRKSEATIRQSEEALRQLQGFDMKGDFEVVKILQSSLKVDRS